MRTGHLSPPVKTPPMRALINLLWTRHKSTLQSPSYNNDTVWIFFLCRFMLQRQAIKWLETSYNIKHFSYCWRNVLKMLFWILLWTSSCFIKFYEENHSLNMLMVLWVVNMNIAGTDECVQLCHGQCVWCYLFQKVVGCQGPPHVSWGLVHNLALIVKESNQISVSQY